MKKIFLLALFAIASSVASYAQNNVFIVDGKQVENFDGSQLVGKKILSFKIQDVAKGKLFSILTEDSLPDSLKGKACRVVSHTIEGIHLKKGDVAGTSPVKVKSVSVQTQKPLIILNGKEYNGSMSDINSATIKNISVYKSNSDAAKAYGEKGKNGVIVITTK